MELKLHKQPVFISEMLINTTAEQPIECDALLPDYCPDIVRILKCSVQPMISSKRVNGKKLEVEGMAIVQVYYSGTSEPIAKAEYKLPFAKTMEMTGECLNPSMNITARSGYVNCRAVNQRRLDIRGAVNITAVVIAAREEQVVTGGEGGGIQLREQNIACGRMVGEVTREIKINEMLEPVYGKPEIKNILRCCATPRLIDQKTADGKIVIKGELQVHMLYCAMTGGCEQMEFIIPTALVIDMPEATEGCSTRIGQELCYCTVEPDAQDNDRKVIALDAAIAVTATVHCPAKATICTDCYSTKCKCDFHSKTMNTLRYEQVLNDPVVTREVMQLPDNVETVIDLWCDVADTKSHTDKGDLCIEPKVSVSMLAKMRDGDIYYFDKNMDVEHRVQCSEKDAIMVGNVSVVGTDFNFAGNDSVEIRCELNVAGVVYSPAKFSCIDNVELDETKEPDSKVQRGLYLYLTSPGENMWDIAKRYNTGANNIEEENEAENGNVPRVLIIPVL